jgi:hypothetical protein
MLEGGGARVLIKEGFTKAVEMCQVLKKTRMIAAYIKLVLKRS